LKPDEFWASVEIDPAKEDDYLSRHSLADGVDVVLKTARDHAIPVWCLSNDVGRWSQKLRRLFGLDKVLAGSVISGDVGIRKPDTEIFELLLRRSGFAASDLVFVDDRRKNVDAAIGLGIDAIEFDARKGFESLINRITLPRG
jgi:HAD superfamily hydrolase (TIGR01509 family)